MGRNANHESFLQFFHVNGCADVRCDFSRWWAGMRTNMKTTFKSKPGKFRVRTEALTSDQVQGNKLIRWSYHTFRYTVIYEYG